MLNNEKAQLEAKRKIRRRRPSARPHAISPPPLIPPSKEESQAKLYLNKITGWEITSWVKAHKFFLVLLLIIFLGGFLRIYDLGAESIYYDEASSILQAKQSLSEVISQAINTQNSPPLYFIILHFQMLLFGTSEIAVRFPSAIFGILSLFFIYKIGCQLFNKKIGLLSSFLLAISSLHIDYSQDVRSYSLFVLMTLVSYYLFIQILKTNNKWFYVGLFIGNILLLYSHVFGLLLIISQIIYIALFWRRYQQQRIKLIFTYLMSAFACIPLVILILPRFSEIVEGGGGNIQYLSRPSLLSIIDTFEAFSGVLLLLPIFFIMFLIGIFTIKRFDGRTSIRIESIREVTLLLLWLSSPIIIPFVLSFILSPIYTLRYVISALPAFLILTAKGIWSFSNRQAIYGIIIFITIISLIGLIQQYIEPVKDQWRETADFIQHNSQEGEIIAITGISGSYCETVQYCLNYYYQGDAEIICTLDWMDSEIIDKELLWLVRRLGLEEHSLSIMEEDLVNNFGSDSVLLENTFLGVKVQLFDLLNE